MAPALGTKDYSRKDSKWSPKPNDYSPRGPTKRGRLCGKCNVEFHGADAGALSWCKEDSLYVCQRCWDRNCLRAGSGQPHHKGMNIRMAYWGLVFLMSFIILFCYPSFYDVYQIQR